MNQKGISNTRIAIIAAIIIVAAAAYFMFDRKSEEPAVDLNNSSASSASGNNNSTQTADQPSSAASTQEALKNNMHTITLETNYGTIEFTTFDADTPKTVNNFITLANKGFYNNLTFHRVIDGFMIQGGDPNGNGSGGPGYQFEDEFSPGADSYKAGYVKGVVAMANAGPNTNGSQFFIVTAEQTPWLDGVHTNFGYVISGWETLDAIENSTIGANDYPVEDIIIEKIILQ